MVLFHRVVFSFARPFHVADAEKKTERRKRAVKRRPANGLEPKDDPWFYEKRIGKESRQGRNIGKRKKPVGQYHLMRRRVPYLDERTGSGKQKVGQTNGTEKESQNLQNGLLAAFRFPVQPGAYRQQEQAYEE